MLSTDTELVLDGRHALIVGRIARIERNLGHGILQIRPLMDSIILAVVKVIVFAYAQSALLRLLIV
jgi:hypothetical protein